MMDPPFTNDGHNEPVVTIYKLFVHMVLWSQCLNVTVSFYIIYFLYLSFVTVSTLSLRSFLFSCSRVLIRGCVLLIKTSLSIMFPLNQ